MYQTFLLLKYHCFYFGGDILLMKKGNSTLTKIGFQC